MKILVFQHLDCEHPGSLRALLNRDGIEWDVVQLDQGEAIPDLEPYDALWVMGGPMDVWDIEENPWLIPEKAAIRHWVNDLKRPYLGLCLGHQLLADALGGTCGPQNPAEIGIMDVELTAAGQKDPLFKDAGKTQKVLQWHGVRVAQPPEGAVVLAKSKLCPNQAMRIGPNVYSMQFHVEIEADTIENWAGIPAYYDALMETIGQKGLDQMYADGQTNMTDFLASSETVYLNYMNIIRG